jgi:hypothetical protein
MIRSHVISAMFVLIVFFSIGTIIPTSVRSQFFNTITTSIPSVTSFTMVFTSFSSETTTLHYVARTTHANMRAQYTTQCYWNVDGNIIQAATGDTIHIDYSSNGPTDVYILDNISAGIWYWWATGNALGAGYQLGCWPLSPIAAWGNVMVGSWDVQIHAPCSPCTFLVLSRGPTVVAEVNISRIIVGSKIVTSTTSFTSFYPTSYTNYGPLTGIPVDNWLISIIAVAVALAIFGLARKRGRHQKS